MISTNSLSHFFLNNVFYNFVIGDAAAFRLNGNVNTQNIREYSQAGEPPSFNIKLGSHLCVMSTCQRFRQHESSYR